MRPDTSSVAGRAGPSIVPIPVYFPVSLTSNSPGPGRRGRSYGRTPVSNPASGACMGPPPWVGVVASRAYVLGASRAYGSAPSPVTRADMTGVRRKSKAGWSPSTGIFVRSGWDCVQDELRRPGGERLLGRWHRLRPQDERESSALLCRPVWLESSADEASPGVALLAHITRRHERHHPGCRRLAKVRPRRRDRVANHLRRQRPALASEQ